LSWRMTTSHLPPLILVSSGSLSFLEALRPPMEQSGRADALGLVLECPNLVQNGVPSQSLGPSDVSQGPFCGGCLSYSPC
jgi:hypothetical protein